MKTLLLLFVAFASISDSASSCCSATPEPAVYSKNSLYQLDHGFTDDAGLSFTLGQLRGRPVVIAMFFSTCTYACPLLLGDMMRLRALVGEERAKELSFVLVSFDTEKDLPPVLKAFREGRGLDDSWKLLHGSKGAVRELAALLGVKYKRQADGSFAHSNLLTVLDAEGEVLTRVSGLQADLTPLAKALAK